MDMVSSPALIHKPNTHGFRLVAVCNTNQPHRPSGTSSVERLWKEYFKNPSLWWDKRKNKRNPTSPDFKHKLTKEKLWVDGWYTPSWVHDMLQKTESPSKGMHNAKEQGLPKNSGWEMLSLEEALTLLERLPQPPSVQNLRCILLKCREKKDRTCAERLHAYICKFGLEAHKSLGNYLIPMLVEVGSMCHAQQVFDGLPDRKEHSWTSLMTGYMECWEPHRAFILYQKMQEDSVNPSGHTFVALLKACAGLKDVERGQEIHVEIEKEGWLERDPFIGSTLVDMYAKCGLLAKAQEVFDKLPVRDAISWTALIGGYAEHGLGQEALNCFEQMQWEGISPDAITFVCCLKACSSIGALDKGREIHNEIARKGLSDGVSVVGNALVDMYTKCGSLATALEVFDKLPVRDEASWNTLIAGFANHGLGEEALNCFKQMQLEGLLPNAVTFVCSLKACGSIRALDMGRVLHAEISRKGLLEIYSFVGNALIDMYAKCGSFVEAREVFDKLPARDAVSWTALISGLAEDGLGWEALDCFEQMQQEGLSPDAVTFACSLKACGSLRAIDKGQEIHAEIARKGWLEKDPVIGNALVDMYAKCGSLAKAREVFNKLPVRDAVSWTALIAGYVENGLCNEALDCFKQMQLHGISPDAVTIICSLKACGSIGAIDTGQEIHAGMAREGWLLERDLSVCKALVDMYAKCGSIAKAQEQFDKLPVRDVISWTVLIGGYADCGLGKEALDCFERMQQEGISPDAATFVCSLKACGSIGAIDKGQELHAEIVRKGLLEREPFVGNALVNMYAKCGALSEAREVFDKLPFRDEVSWNALTTGYARIGETENVFSMFERMREQSLKPDGVTFLGVLTACSHDGLVDKGRMYFKAMSKDYGLTPTIEHHNCLVDLLSRAGCVDEAVAMMKNMAFDPNATAWHTVLSACQRSGNVELGRQAFEHALQLDAKDAAAYVLMSNIYADVYTPGGQKEC